MFTLNLFDDASAMLSAQRAAFVANFQAFVVLLKAWVHGLTQTEALFYGLGSIGVGIVVAKPVAILLEEILGTVYFLLRGIIRAVEILVEGAAADIPAANQWLHRQARQATYPDRVMWGAYGVALYAALAFIGDGAARRVFAQLGDIIILAGALWVGTIYHKTARELGETLTLTLWRLWRTHYGLAASLIIVLGAVSEGRPHYRLGELTVALAIAGATFVSLYTRPRKAAQR